MRFCNLIPACRECGAKGFCKDVFLDGVCVYGPEIEELYRRTTEKGTIEEWIVDVQLVFAKLVRKRMG